MTQKTPTNKHWRSLDQKRDPEGNHARSAEEVRDANPSVLDPRSLISRRGFMQVSGATAALLGTEACVRRPVENILPYSQAPEHVVPGVPLHFATVTERRGDAIGLLVTSHEGRPTKVEGNPGHPGSLGGTDVWAQASVLGLYDPDRSRGPAQGASDATFEAFDEALRARLEEHGADGGRGLRLLAPPSISPTFLRVRTALKTRFPNATVHTYSPLSSDTADAATKATFGQPLKAVVAYNHARVVLALDADFMLTEPGAVRASRAFADGRRLQGPDGEMTRLYAVEGNYSITGATADHRLRLAPSQVGRYLRALAKELVGKGLALPTPISAALGSPSVDGIPGVWIAAVADDLLAARGGERGRQHHGSAIVVGSSQPASVHALAHALNHALDNVGRSVHYFPPVDLETTEAVADIGALVQAMRGGQVKTLLVLGGNPAYDAPAELDFAEALADVEWSLALTRRRNETAQHTTWHVPLAHELETWGDLRGLDGTMAIQQPLIAPLWGGRSAIEILGLVAGERNWRGHSLVRATFRAMQVEALGFERAWRQALHRGVVEGTATDSIGEPTLDEGAVARLLGGEQPAAPTASNIEVAFVPCSKLFDGRHGNNTWRLELPEQMSKLSWGNAALMSPTTASALGLTGGEILRLGLGGKTADIPAWIMPGHADNCLTLPLGWGRMNVGRYGEDQGSNVYPLRRSDGMGFASGVNLEKTARREFMAQSQEHHAMGLDIGVEERPLSIQGTLAEYQEKPDFPQWRSVEMDTPPLWETVDYSEGHKWGLAIDLNACNGCNACVIACQAENNVPSVGKRQLARGREMYWLRLDRYFVGEDENDPQVAVQPVACQQCEEAPCENVCPVVATAHSPEGLNDMAYNRCIGTRYCMNNCPYKVRRFNYLSWHNYLDDKWANYDYIPETRKMQFNPNVTVRMRGVVEKCTYCVQRIQEAKIGSRRDGRPLRDGDVKSACEQSCPTQAIAFGDLNDPSSRVANLHERDRHYRLLAELGTRPRTVFLARIRNENPAMVDQAAAGERTAFGGEEAAGDGAAAVRDTRPETAGSGRAASEGAEAEG